MPRGFAPISPACGSEMRSAKVDEQVQWTCESVERPRNASHGAFTGKIDSFLGRKLSVGAEPTRKGAGGLVNPSRVTTNRPTDSHLGRWPRFGSIVTISGQA